MSMIRKAISALIVLSVLAFQSVSQAETPTQEGQPTLAGQVVEQARSHIGSIATALATPMIDTKELQCLAKNIFFEAASEPEEGKVAVGLVTLNRMEDPRFPKTVCGVVDQRVTTMIERQGIRETRTAWGGVKKEPTTIWSKLTICQFSWRCMFVKTPKSQDERWVESQRIAEELLSSDYSYADLREKYNGALYFHAAGIRPAWARQKQHITRVGGHRFYAENPRVQSF